MPEYRGSIVFEAAGQGWSEHYYTTQPDMDTAETQFLLLADKRTLFSPPIVKIKALKLHQMNVRLSARRLTPTGNHAQGRFGATDTPVPSINMVNDALLLELYAGDTWKNRIFMRGMPDVIFADGIFVGDVDWALAFDDNTSGTYGSFLHNGDWKTRTKDPATNTFVYHPVVKVNILGATTRKPGRPFGLRPGRRRTQA